MTYIADSDIKRDVLANQFASDFPTYHDLVDDHIDEIAEGQQVSTDNISVGDDGYLSSKFLRRYAAAWVCKEIFCDRMGINNISLAVEEKYRVKYEIYRDKVKVMKPRITTEMLTNKIASRMDTSASHNMYRA